MRRLLDVIEEAFGCYQWILSRYTARSVSFSRVLSLAHECSRHLALMLTSIEKLPFGMVDKTPFFGNYRVEIICMLFGHVTDIHNFEVCSFPPSLLLSLLRSHPCDVVGVACVATL